MEVATCHAHQTVKQLSGLWLSVNPEKSYAFLLAKGVDSFPQSRYQIFVGSVAVSTTTSTDTTTMTTTEQPDKRGYQHVENLQAQRFNSLPKLRT